jgi:hypothetical protein
LADTVETDDPTLHPDYIRFIVDTYKDDFNAYRRDVLGMGDAEWQDRVGDDLVHYRRVAVAAGHGIGKTAFAAAAIHWFLATRPNPAIVATANTDTQLKTKLWRELAKINAKAKNKSWFEWKAESFSLQNLATARAIPIAWSENNAEAFAGTHEQHVLGVFDEASGIPRVIFTTFSGAMSTEGARWLILGNSTKNEGYFHDAAHGKLAWRRPGDEHMGKWKSHVVASYDSPFVDPAWVEEMKHALGEDSDDYRVRVMGLPPRFSGDQYIPAGFVEQALTRQVQMFERWPLVLGVDVGHTNDRSVIVARRGQIMLPKIVRFKGIRTTDFARAIADEITFYRSEHRLDPEVIIEAVGIGVGVVETLEDMGFEKIHGIHPGMPPEGQDRDLYTNIRAQMWAQMREWFEGNVSVPNDTELLEDMAVVRRKATGNSAKLLIEGKDEMRRRGIRSPDNADALALTFSLPFDLLPKLRKDDWERDFNNSFDDRGSHGWMG